MYVFINILLIKFLEIKDIFYFKDNKTILYIVGGRQYYPMYMSITNITQRFG